MSGSNRQTGQGSKLPSSVESQAVQAIREMTIFWPQDGHLWGTFIGRPPSYSQ